MALEHRPASTTKSRLSDLRPKPPQQGYVDASPSGETRTVGEPRSRDLGRLRCRPIASAAPSTMRTSAAGGSSDDCAR